MAGTKMILKDLIVSRVRIKILRLFFLSPDKLYHVRAIVRKTDEEINAVRRELQRLEKAGLLAKEKRANRLLYSLRHDYPLYFDLLHLMVKVSGMGKKIIKKRKKLGKVKFAMITGRYARNLPRKKNEVDLLIVGQLVLPELNKIVREEEVKKEKEINYTVMTEDEFEFRKKRRDPFVMSILWGSRIMVIGDEQELVNK